MRGVVQRFLAITVVSLGVWAADTQRIDAVVALWRAGKVDDAMESAAAAIKAEPRNARLFNLRAQMRSMTGQHALADEDLSAAIQLEPDSASLHQTRAQLRFRLGRIEDSVKDFDRANELAPKLVPQNWQRGIALYYAGRFKDGRLQFETHQTFNTQDVENAAWHFLCTAREQGIEAARKTLIPIERDPRVPMREVQSLFAGKLGEEDVLEAAGKADDDGARREQEFYAHLYLGLYFEATRDLAKRDIHIRKAAELSEKDNYMGIVSRIHADRIKAPAASKP
jgi:lipoprotein NlpI